MATQIGVIELIAKIDTSQYKRGAKEIDAANKNIEQSGEQTSDNINKGFSTAAKVGLAAVAAAAVAVGAAITKNIGSAIRRVDTLNNANRTFANMGFQTREVESSMEELVDSITGLPTPLDSAVRGMQSLAATYGDIGQGQKIFTALNNAILGFGGTAAEVDNAIQQLSQLPMDGPLDAQTWNSLRNSGLTPVLVAMAKDMGIGINEMKEQFGEGELTVKDFTEALTEMDKEGGGGMKSLEKIARDATSGIGTGWENMQTAITRGIATVINAIGSENISRAISRIGEAFETGLNVVSASIAFFQKYEGIIKNIAIAITGALIPAILRYTVLQTIAGVQALIAGARMAAAWLLALGPIGIIAAAVGAATALIITNWDSVRGFVVGVWQSITKAVSTAFNWVKRNWPLLLAVLTGPFGIAAAVIIKNFDKIRSAVGNVWSWIKGVFKTIGSVAATIIKAPVNAIIGFAQRTINGFIKAINSAIGAINRIPGVNIGQLSTLNIPKLAQGGIITSPTLAMVGEGNEPEAVIPLSKLDDILQRERGESGDGNSATIQQTNNIYTELDMNRVNRRLTWELHRA